MPALALALEAPLPDAQQEQRAKALFHEIRCVVCQGESIADSGADIAGDLRRDVRKRVEEGESDDAIKAMLVSRYGDSILMSPPVNRMTALLWIGPFLVLFIAALAVRRFFKQGGGE